MVKIKKNTIQNQQITFVIHGEIQSKPYLNPKKNYTDILINNIKTFFPGSTLIVSTWTDKIIPTHITDLDEVYYSKDPGPSYISYNCERSHNMDRHIQSSKEGLARVQTKYSCVLRPDLSIKSRKFIEKYEMYESYIDNRNLIGIKNPILALSGGTLYEKAFLPTFLFHTCDFLYFGHTNDLKKIFNLPIESDGRKIQEKIHFYFEKHFESRRSFLMKSYKNPFFIQRYIAEAFPIIKHINNFIEAPIDHSWVLDKELSELSFKWHTQSVILISSYLNDISWLRTK